MIWTILFSAAGAAAPVADPQAAATPDADPVDRTVQRAFGRMDTNVDGKLDAAEVAKLLERRAARKAESGTATAVKPRQVSRFVKRMDSDGDGAVSLAEFAANRAARAKAATPAN